jgi:aminomethyltransferase
VVDDLIAYVRSPDEVLLVPNAANTAEVVRRLAAAAPDGVEVSDEHTTYAVIAVQGPRCEEVLDTVGLSTGLDYMHFADDRWQDRPVVVCRTGYTGERGFELLPLWADAEPLWDALMTAAAAVEGLPCGLGARDTLRTEMGYPLHGQDLSLDITPVMARVSWAVGWGKDRFFGREVLLAEREAARSGAGRLAWGLLCTGRGVPRAECSVRAADGAEVGTTTSGTFSPTLKQGIALALLDRSVSEGDELIVDVRGRELPVRVIKPPFVSTGLR